MNPRKPLFYTYCLLLLHFGQAYGTGLQSQIPIDCIPSIEGKHYQIYCLDDAGADQIPAPVATAGCGTLERFDYEERFIDLGCDQTGFQGYFEPSNWIYNNMLGDTGVDVTGVPNSTLVEGANPSLVSVTPGGVSGMEILVPADGMIAFDWRNVGSSNFSSEKFSLFLNEEQYVLSDAAASRGRFRHPVRKGDKLRLQFQVQEERTIEINRFRLLSNTRYILERHWTATDDKGRSNHFTQLITIEQPNIADVRFPEDMKTRASSHQIAPEYTGFPFIDRDGNTATTADRYLIRDQQCGFRVEYVDEIQEWGGECIIYRHWMLTDPCGSNTMKETQIIRLIHTPETKDCPANNLEFVPGQQSEQYNLPEISSSGFSAEHKSNNQDHSDPIIL